MNATLKSSPQERRPLLQRLAEFLHPGPDSKDELMVDLQEAHARELIDKQSWFMLQGVLKMIDRVAGDVMVAAPRMDTLDIDADFERLLNIVIDTGHSRFPVYEESKDNIIGILLAKDLLKKQRSPQIHLRALLRPATFVPETKGLNDLLSDFRGKHQHMALVVDEFGKTAGLVTIEDILEEIVGEIEDEFDTHAHERARADIVALPQDGAYRVAGQTKLTELMTVLPVQFTPSELEHFETIGGLVAHRMGYVPRKGEEHLVAGLRLTVLLTNGGAVKWFRATLLV